MSKETFTSQDLQTPWIYLVQVLAVNLFMNMHMELPTQSYKHVTSRVQQLGIAIMVGKLDYMERTALPSAVL